MITHNIYATLHYAGGDRGTEAGQLWRKRVDLNYIIPIGYRIELRGGVSLTLDGAPTIHLDTGEVSAFFGTVVELKDLKTREARVRDFIQNGFTIVKDYEKWK
ncbi:MAG: hypothetical protein E6R03_04280 [Hyphomicrobiaceae bacterium]|nr:MAG: hypothetical protein E6R03_04280 [Hyphomicrobiaceae bacterium]